MNYNCLYNHINTPRAIMIRHAKRFPIQSMENAFDALLTEDGKQMAYQYGNQLNALSPVYLYHSPVKRCKQTCVQIQKGLQANNITTIQPQEVINLGGPYINAQWDEVSRLVEEMGYDSFLRYWFNGHIDKKIIMPLQEAARVQSSILIHQMHSNPEATHINISHDWNIMIISEYYFDFRFEDIGYPDYLNGVCVYYNNQKLILQYHEQSVSLPI